MKYADNRVRYTKMILQQALVTLLDSKTINQITIKEICEQAQVNRGTFYLHYTSIDDLLDEVENVFLQNYKDFFNPDCLRNLYKNILIEILDVLRENHKIVLAMIDSNHFQSKSKIMEIIRQNTIATWQTKYSKYSEEDLSVMFDFVYPGAMHIISGWLRGEISYSTSECADFLICLENSCCHSIGVFRARQS